MRRRAFTLVELLVVITIIVVLAGIIFPVALSMAGKGAETKCMMQLKELSRGLMIYKSENKKYPPYSGRQFVAALYRSNVVNEARLFHCPASDFVEGDGWEKQAEDALKGKLADPVDEAATSYAGRRNDPKHKTTITSAERNKIPASRIAVFCDQIWEGPKGPETNHGDRLFVAYLDNHVDMLKVKENLGGDLRMGEGATHEDLQVLGND
jgi:prepilin-type N-terminal cleavage/methylation domain-containing protein